MFFVDSHGCPHNMAQPSSDTTNFSADYRATVKHWQPSLSTAHHSTVRHQQSSFSTELPPHFQRTITSSQNGILPHRQTPTTNLYTLTDDSHTIGYVSEQPLYSTEYCLLSDTNKNLFIQTNIDNLLTAQLDHCPTIRNWQSPSAQNTAPPPETDYLPWAMTTTAFFMGHYGVVCPNSIKKCYHSTIFTTTTIFITLNNITPYTLKKVKSRCLQFSTISFLMIVDCIWDLLFKYINQGGTWSNYFCLYYSSHLWF